MKVPTAPVIEYPRRRASSPTQEVATFLRCRPTAVLEPYIRCFWWSRRVAPQDFWEHILPSGGVQMLFALHDSPITCLPGPDFRHRVVWSDSIVHGPQSSYYIAGPKPCGAVLGVAFRPGGATAILGAAMADLMDQHVTLGTLWGKPGQLLQERLRAAGSPGELFQILEKELSARIRERLVVHPAIARALTLRSCAKVGDAQRESGYSPKHFISLFRSATGLTPKHYFRIQRFNAVSRCLAAGVGSNLAELAAAAGYSDQAHLTREFGEFSGTTPTRYFPATSDQPFHHRTALAMKPGLR